MNPVVFVSHSSSDRARAEALVTALEAGGVLRTTFDVRDLRAGEEWQPQLYKWMARCHAGVVLVTAEVMKRPAWVLQEATLLRSRSMLEGKDFRFFVLIDQAVLQSAVWKKWFAPLAFPQLQMRVLADPADDVSAFVDEVRAAVAPLAQARGHFERLQAVIASALRDPLADATVRQYFDDAFAQADAEFEDIVGGDTGTLQRMAQQLCAGHFGGFQDLGGLFQKLQAVCKQEHGKRMLGTLRSYWVPQILAARLADAVARVGPYAAGDAPPPNVVLVQAAGREPAVVATMHRERQFLPYGELGHLIELPEPLGTADELDRAIAEELFVELDGPDAEALRAEELQALDEKRRRPMPFYTFAHLEAPATPEPLLEVARRWWAVVFIVTADEARYAEWRAHLGIEDPELPDGMPPVAHRVKDYQLALKMLAKFN